MLVPLTGLSILEGENVFHNSYIMVKKIFPIKIGKYPNNSNNFLVNSWYLNISLLVGPIFMPKYWPLIFRN